MELEQFKCEVCRHNMRRKPVKRIINPFEDEMVCPYCKANVTDTYSYCPNCGQKLDWSVENG